jgi:hypothetical protein
VDTVAWGETVALVRRRWVRGEQGRCSKRWPLGRVTRGAGVHPRSATDSTHVVGPLIACRASFAWAARGTVARGTAGEGARPEAALAIGPQLRPQAPCPSACITAARPPRTSAASTAETVYVPEASRVPWGSGPDLPLCSAPDVLRKVGSVPSGLGEALGSLCWLRAPRHTFGLSLGSALCTVGRQAAGTYLKLPSRRLFSRESSELLLCRLPVLMNTPPSMPCVFPIARRKPAPSPTFGYKSGYTKVYAVQITLKTQSPNLLPSRVQPWPPKPAAVKPYLSDRLLAS